MKEELQLQKAVLHILDNNNPAYSTEFLDDTMPGGPIERTIIFQAPFDRCDREQDYETVWKHFEDRFEK